MKILLLGLLIFALGFMVHLVIWKIRLPKNHNKALLKIFFLTIAICLLGTWLSCIFFSGARLLLPQGPAEYLHVSLLSISLVLCYLIFYSVIEADSPSITMVMYIANAGRAGLAKNDLDSQMTDELLLKPRVFDLLRDKLIYAHGNRYRLTPSGILVAHIFTYYRKLLNTDKGG